CRPASCPWRSSRGVAAECCKSARIAKCTKGATKRVRFGTETGQKQQLRDREQFSLSLNYHNIQSACPRPATDGLAPCPPRLARNARTYLITLANGTVQTVTTSDPGRLLLTGQPADPGVRDVTQLRGNRRTR